MPVNRRLYYGQMLFLNSLAPSVALAIAQVLLGVHILSALFIIAGVFIVPLGLARGWPFVHVLWWRALHMIVFGIVVVQKLLGQTCFLSVWEEHFLRIARHAEYPVPLIHSMGDRAIHIPLPLSFTVTFYTGVWLLMLALWIRRPPRRSIAQK